MKTYTQKSNATNQVQSVTPDYALPYPKLMNYTYGHYDFLIGDETSKSAYVLFGSGSPYPPDDTTSLTESYGFYGVCYTARGNLAQFHSIGFTNVAAARSNNSWFVDYGKVLGSLEIRCGVAKLVSTGLYYPYIKKVGGSFFHAVFHGYVSTLGSTNPSNYSWVNYIDGNQDLVIII